MRLLFSIILSFNAYCSLALSYCVPVPPNGVNGYSINNIFLESLNAAPDTFSTYLFSPDTLYLNTCFMLPGFSYSISITANSNHSASKYGAWIDWNNDTTFSSSEKLGEFTTSVAGQIGNITFTVPLNAVSGKLRLRIRCTNTAGMTACTNYTSGQTADFSVTILNNNFEHNFYTGWEFSSTGTDYIDDVTFGTINQTGSGHVNGPVYNDYTRLGTNVNCCAAIPISIQTVAPTSNINHCDVYVDLNHNGSFTQNELLKTFNPGIGTVINNGNITIPSSTGSAVMRIMLYTTSGLSEVEDYRLNVTSSTATAIPVAAIGASLYSDCPSGCSFIGCPGAITFTDLSCGVPVSWKWNVTGALSDSSSQQNPSFTFIPGNYTITLISSNASGSDTATALLRVRQPFHSLNLGPDTSLCSGDSVVLFAPTPSGNECLQYLWSNGSVADRITIYAPGQYAVRLDTCTRNACPATDTVNVQFSPVTYNVTGGGFYCSGSPAPTVGLDDTQTNVSYQLYRNGTVLGVPVPGTGHAISFGIQAQSGAYTVQATNNTSGCTGVMSGTANVTLNPLPQRFLVVGGGTYCSGTGAPVAINGSQAGVSYQLYVDGVLTGAPMTGNGGTINFPLQNTGGTYTAIATNINTSCTDTMNGNAVVIILPGPLPHTVHGGGLFCAGSAAAAVNINSSDSGAIYYLYRDSLPTGDSLTGDGGPVTFDSLLHSGEYTIFASSGTACNTPMNGSAIITVKPAPDTFNVVTSGPYCIGGSPVQISIDSSQLLVNYRLWTGGFPTGGVVSGTGSALTIASLINPGIYNVIATNTTNGCTATMNGVATVVVDSFPAQFNVTGGGSFCEGDSGVEVGLSNSVAGIQYSLLYNGDSTGVILNGTGSPLNFGRVDSAGQFTVIAENASHCAILMNNNAVISMNPLPVCSVTSLASDTVCIYQSPFALSGVPPGGIMHGAGIANDTLSPLMAGQGNILITYEYTDVNGCSSEANDSVYVDMCIGIDELTRENELSFYPNPASEKLTIITMDGALRLEVTDVSGKQKTVFINPEKMIQLDLETFAEGIYFIRIVTAASTFSRPFVICH